MKRISIPVLLLAALLLFSGCSGRRTESLNPATAPPVRTQAPAAEPTAAPETAATQIPQKDPVTLAFSEFGKYGLIRTDGETVLPFVYDSIMPAEAPGLFFLVRYPQSSAKDSEEFAVADAQGNILTDWSSVYPVSSRAGVLFFPDNERCLLLAPETGEVISEFSGFLDGDTVLRPQLAGDLLQTIGGSSGRRLVSIYSVPALREQKNDPSFQVSCTSDWPMLMQAGENYILTVYGSSGSSDSSMAYLLGPDGYPVHDIRYPEIDAVSRMDNSWVPSGEYAAFSEDGSTHGILHLPDGQVVMKPAPGYISRICGDYAVIENDGYKLYSLKQNRYLHEDLRFDQIVLSPSGTTYGRIHARGWFALTEDSAAEIPGVRDASELLVLSQRLAFIRWEDSQVLWFDAGTLKPVSGPDSYGYLYSILEDSSFGPYYAAYRTRWSTYDLLDRNGDVILKNIRYVHSADVYPYITVEQGFTLGIFDLETRQWVYQTSAFSALND